jgi:hypothetical protein
MTAMVEHPYERPMISALKIQASLGIFAIFGLPGEWFVKACIFSSIGFWVGVVIIRLRRPVPTAGDLYYVRRGLLYVGVLGMIAAMYYWDYRSTLNWRP